MTRWAAASPSRALSRALAGLPAAATDMAAVLMAFGAALLLEHAAHLHVDIVIMAVVLTATLARTQRGAACADRLAELAVLAAAAAAASETGSLIARYPVVGEAVFTVAVAATVWIRRFGKGATRGGTVIVIPFVALLVTHAQGIPAYGAGHDLWSAIVAVIAAGSVALAQLVAEPRSAARRQAGARPAGGRLAGGRLAGGRLAGGRLADWRLADRRLADQRAAGPAQPESPRRLRASTRMAAQLGVALALAFAVGHVGFPDHWPWLVLTAFIVCSGARDRGDVLHKGILRAGGAGAGTVVATLIAGAFPAGDAWSVVIIFAVLGIAIWLRPLSYGYWAGSVTAMLSLLYGYYGESAPSLLRTRMEEIAIGAVIGIVASWLILPVRTGDVLKRRVADSLAALSDVFAGPSDGVQLRFAESAHRVELLARPVLAQRFVALIRPGIGPLRADAIEAVREMVPPVREYAAGYGDLATDQSLARLRSAITANAAAVRRAIGDRPGDPYRPLPEGSAESRTHHQQLKRAPIKGMIAPAIAAQGSRCANHARVAQPPRRVAGVEAVRADAAGAAAQSAAAREQTPGAERLVSAMLAIDASLGAIYCARGAF